MMKKIRKGDYRNALRIDENIGDRVFGIIEKTCGYKSFEKIMECYDKLENWADKNFEFGKGVAIQIFAGMGLAYVTMPVATEICLETPVRAAYEGMKKIKDYYSRFSE